mmetsp:Transcript_5887/g.16737  ORF Transcript_5887/g.16737 Transcript_5887/m.16737 type:complete len:115 (-) Transcript_5887:58-402(-)
MLFSACAGGGGAFPHPTSIALCLLCLSLPIPLLTCFLSASAACRSSAANQIGRHRSISLLMGSACRFAASGVHENWREFEREQREGRMCVCGWMCWLTSGVKSVYRCLRMDLVR